VRGGNEEGEEAGELRSPAWLADRIGAVDIYQLEPHADKENWAVPTY
jgi:hypothetical protein